MSQGDGGRETASDSDDDFQDDDLQVAKSSKPPRAFRSRDFQEVNRWSHDDHTLDEIDALIRRHIQEVNDSAGLKVKAIPGQHKDRDDKYGVMQKSRCWPTQKGNTSNIILVCPLAKRCKCPFEVKIVRNAEQTILFVCNEHTAADHAKEKDRSFDIGPTGRKLRIAKSPSILLIPE